MRLCARICEKNQNVRIGLCVGLGGGRTEFSSVAEPPAGTSSMRPTDSLMLTRS